MKRIHIEAAILSIVYIGFTIIAIQYYGTDTSKITNVFTYPARLIIKPITNGFNIESINLSLFTAYFLWSFNCVYMSFLKKSIHGPIITQEK
tara:strand:- start:2823 stop:3098 length:276 start_codon:yes stop_codon:yes gene_type:complete